mmetsp:Transcript_18614/g.60906  ORF Transcript_18614/g.60906 Transcript_18614/m.60906 type:complete len:233 (-) Transcript_18614:393-1091(-)
MRSLTSSPPKGWHHLCFQSPTRNSRWPRLAYSWRSGVCGGEGDCPDWSGLTRVCVPCSSSRVRNESQSVSVTHVLAWTTGHTHSWNTGHYTRGVVCVLRERHRQTPHRDTHYLCDESWGNSGQESSHVSHGSPRFCDSSGLITCSSWLRAPAARTARSTSAWLRRRHSRSHCTWIEPALRRCSPSSARPGQTAAPSRTARTSSAAPSRRRAQSWFPRRRPVLSWPSQSEDPP